MNYQRMARWSVDEMTDCRVSSTFRISGVSVSTPQERTIWYPKATTRCRFVWLSSSRLRTSEHRWRTTDKRVEKRARLQSEFAFLISWRWHVPLAISDAFRRRLGMLFSYSINTACSWHRVNGTFHCLCTFDVNSIYWSWHFEVAFEVGYWMKPGWLHHKKQHVIDS